jgi:hypothetical protein
MFPLFPVHVVGGTTQVLKSVCPQPSAWQVRDAEPVSPGGQESISMSLTLKVLPSFPVHVVDGGTHVL